MSQRLQGPGAGGCRSLWGWMMLLGTRAAWKGRQVGSVEMWSGDEVLG